MTLKNRTFLAIRQGLVYPQNLEKMTISEFFQKANIPLHERDAIQKAREKRLRKKQTLSVG